MERDQGDERLKRRDGMREVSNRIQREGEDREIRVRNERQKIDFRED